MTLIVALHDPTRARYQKFTSCETLCGFVSFVDKNNREIGIYTTPEAACAIADAFNAAIAKTEAAR